MPDAPAPKNIDDALLAIYRSGKLYVQKANRNEQQSYNYVSEADFLALVRPQFAEHGIICIPSYSVVSEGILTTAKGTVMQKITLQGVCRFVHAASATFRDVPTIGQGTDQQDKAAYKAMTGALKYAIRQVLMIETGDDPEAPKTDETGQAPPPTKFMVALNEQKLRLADGNPKAVERVLQKLAPDVTDLDALPVETKKAIIAALRDEPPF